MNPLFPHESRMKKTSVRSKCLSSCMENNTECGAV